MLQQKTNRPPPQPLVVKVAPSEKPIHHLSAKLSSWLLLPHVKLDTNQGVEGKRAQMEALFILFIPAAGVNKGKYK